MRCEVEVNERIRKIVRERTRIELEGDDVPELASRVERRIVCWWTQQSQTVRD